MVLRSYPIEPNDPDLVAAAAAEGVPVVAAAQGIADIDPGTMAGMRAWIVSPESWAAGPAEWRAAWPILSGRSDAAVRFLMRFLAAKTGAYVHDPGS